MYEYKFGTVSVLLKVCEDGDRYRTLMSSLVLTLTTPDITYTSTYLPASLWIHADQIARVLAMLRLPKEESQ